MLTVLRLLLGCKLREKKTQVNEKEVVFFIIKLEHEKEKHYTHSYTNLSENKKDQIFEKKIIMLKILI